MSYGLNFPDLNRRAALEIQLQVVEAQGPADFERAFSEMSTKGAGALVVHSTPAFVRSFRVRQCGCFIGAGIYHLVALYRGDRDWS
jgi:hypothetical protein